MGTLKEKSLKASSTADSFPGYFGLVPTAEGTGSLTGETPQVPMAASSPHFLEAQGMEE